MLKKKGRKVWCEVMPISFVRCTFVHHSSLNLAVVNAEYEMGCCGKSVVGLPGIGTGTSDGAE
jgi:hypothetical protein